MPEAGFQPADYSTKWQRPTIRPSSGLDNKGNVNVILKDVLFSSNMRRNLISDANMGIARYFIKWG